MSTGGYLTLPAALSSQLFSGVRFCCQCVNCLSMPVRAVIRGQAPRMLTGFAILLFGSLKHLQLAGVFIKVSFGQVGRKGLRCTGGAASSWDEFPFVLLSVLLIVSFPCTCAGKVFICS